MICKQVSRAFKAKKRVSVLATSTSMTRAREKTPECISYIHYLVWFMKNTNKYQVQVLFDLESEVNTIHPSFTKQLGFASRLKDIGEQKIDNTSLDIHEMVVAAFSIVDKANQVRFFEEMFLVANVSPEVIFKILFLSLSSGDIDSSG